MPNIVTAADAETAADYYSEFEVWHSNVATGTHQEVNWVKFKAGSTYPLHSHPYEQTSIMISGRMRLTVGDEVREVGAGDHHVELQQLVRRPIIGRPDHVVSVQFLRRFSAMNLNGSIGDHFVKIHVRLRTAAGLPNTQRKMVVKLAFDNLVASPHDQIRLTT